MMSPVEHGRSPPGLAVMHLKPCQPSPWRSASAMEMRRRRKIYIHFLRSSSTLIICVRLTYPNSVTIKIGQHR
jgi:hypothetical protein